MKQVACQTKIATGIAPFGNQSGIGLNGKNEMNHLANKRIKALIYCAASSAIQHDPQIKAYYNRKVEEGKNEMRVVNIIKNKLIHRVFAVIKRGLPYLTLGKHAA